MTEVLQDTLEVVADAMAAYIFARVCHDWQSTAPQFSLKEILSLPAEEAIPLSVWGVGAMDIDNRHGTLISLVPVDQAERFVELTSEKLRQRLDSVEEGIPFKLSTWLEKPPYEHIKKLNVYWDKHLT